MTPYTELRYVTGYELTRKYVDVRYIVRSEGLRCYVKSPAKKIVAHILLPEGKTPKALLVNGKEIPFETSTVGESRYVDATVAPKDGIADFELRFCCLALLHDMYPPEVEAAIAAYSEKGGKVYSWGAGVRHLPKGGIACRGTYDAYVRLKSGKWGKETAR